MSADLRARIAELEAEIELLAIGHRSLKQASIEALERAEQAEAEVERLKAERAGWRSMAGVAEVEVERDDYAARLKAVDKSWTQLAAERDQLRAAVERVREVLDYFDGQIIALESGNPAVGSAFRFTFTKIRAALDQAPAAEQDGGGR